MKKQIVLFTAVVMMLPAIGRADLAGCMQLFTVTLSTSSELSYRVLKDNVDFGYASDQEDSFTCTTLQGKASVSVQNGVDEGIIFRASSIKGAMGAPTICLVIVETLIGGTPVAGSVMNTVTGGEAAAWNRFLKGDGCVAVEEEVPLP
jgi:hypothetical protein